MHTEQPNPYEETELTDAELAERARKSLALERVPEFDMFKKLLRDQADNHRRMAQTCDPARAARRMQLLDMAMGLDDVLDLWDDSVQQARETLGDEG